MAGFQVTTEVLRTILQIMAAHPPKAHAVSTWSDSVQHLGSELRSRSWGRLHILIAEDNLINQQYIVNVLEQEGYSSVVASNGREALAALERESFDLVLMDIHMPEMDGFEATSNIRARERFSGRRTPIIAVTAHAMAGDRDKCMAAGMDAYISKPVRRQELTDAIALLAQKRKFVFSDSGDFHKNEAGKSQNQDLHSQIP